MLSGTLNSGIISSIRDGIYQASGLLHVMSGEMVLDVNGSLGIAINLESASTGIVFFDDVQLLPGDFLFRSFEALSINVDPCHVGLVYNTIGNTISNSLELCGYSPHRD